MANDLTDARFMPPTPSLPQHVVDLATAVGTVQHPGQPVRYNLPVGCSISEQTRREAEALLEKLRDCLDPASRYADKPAREAKLAILTIMLMGFAIGNGSELGMDAKFDLYESALDDVPAWAVAAALRLWTRGECPADVERHPQFKYAPGPATLRGIALAEIEPHRRSAHRLTNLLAAMPIEAAMDPKPMPGSRPGVATLRRM